MRFTLFSASNSGPVPIAESDDLIDRLREEYSECDVGPECKDHWCRLARDAERRIALLEYQLKATT